MIEHKTDGYVSGKPVPTPWQERVDRPGEPGSAPTPSVPAVAALPTGQQRAIQSLKRIATTVGHRFDFRVGETVIRRNRIPWCTVLGAVITVYTLFEPWLVGKNLDGQVVVNAFGRVRVSTTLVGQWSRLAPPGAVATAQWSILAVCAGAVTITAIMMNYLYRSRRLLTVATGSSVLGAVFVIAALIYLDSRGEALRGTVGQGGALSVGSQLGYIIRAMAGNGAYPVPGLHTVQRVSSSLTGWAFFAAAVSVTSAVGSTIQWVTQRTTANVALTEAAPDHKVDEPALAGAGGENLEVADDTD